MTAYTFICLGHDCTVATVDNHVCEDEGAALLLAERMFSENLHIRDWPNCQHIEVYQGDRLIVRIDRSAQANRPLDSQLGI